MTSAAGRWWRARSLAVRLTVIATAVLAAGLVVGTAGMATLFVHGRVDAVDADARSEATTIASLVRSGQLPDPLPAPADQPVLAQVVDAAGTVLAATPSASRVVPLLPLSVTRDHLGGQAFTTDATALGSAPLRVIVTTSSLHGSSVTVVSAVLYTDVHGTLVALLRTLVIAVPVVLVAAAIATWLAVGSALRPVDELRAAADRVADTRGRQAPQLPAPASRDELARLARTLNRMLARLHAATEQQVSFIADAAHELRSPIAAIRTQLDVALSMPTDATEWEQVARDVRTDAERVSRLAEDLLLLARLDSGAPPRRVPVDVRALAGLVGDPLEVEGDPQALQRALDNLVANARRHARRHVRVGAEEVDGAVVLTVDDDGDGVAPADRERVFQRWLRLDDARDRDHGGAGLGLAIARSVARSHGGDVTLTESPLGGARAVLRLPAADADRASSSPLNVPPTDGKVGPGPAARGLP
jgi:signal transduction histidine kinase